MFTQCPECQTVFRVTAENLQQAGGRVRCGNCGTSFSAIERLSEKPPLEQQNAIEEHRRRTAEMASGDALGNLDRLSGSDDVRIEDTGVEWRVFADDADADDDSGSTAGAVEDPGSLRWYIEDEQQASDTPNRDFDLPEISDSIDPNDPPAQRPNPDEMRFDDNTPLPDDFVGGENDGFGESAAPQRRTSDYQRQERADFEELQSDLALGEPDDWMDLLDEVDQSAGEGNVPLDVEEELAAIHNELASGPPPIDPDETADLPIMPPTPADLDSQFEMQAEALGLARTDVAEPPADEATDAGAVDAPPEFEDMDITVAEEALVSDPGDEGQASELVIDEQQSGAVTRLLESTGAFEKQILEAKAALENEFSETDEQDVEDDADEPSIDVSAADLSLVVDNAVDVGRSVGEPAEPAGALEFGLDDEREQPASTSEEHVVPPPTEEEISINEEIDQELLMAAKDRDFATALVEDPASLFDEDSPEVETIIMEGESVHGSFDEEQREADTEAAAGFDDPAVLVDTYAINRGKVRGGRRSTDPPGLGMIATVIALAVFLVGQIMHSSRETLSTIGAFNQTLGPVYRVFGSPITPEWDVKGWQFETTSGSTDDDEQVLTIFSRIVNRAGQPLPYPLVHVSLTDRWEEIIGSKVLEPGDYLAGDLDPSRPVAADDSFTAVITIESLSEDATGFKLNVCYRVDPGRIRCATEDFKD